jgi:hypothetical protein
MRFPSLPVLGVALALAGTAACTDNSGPNGTDVGGLYALTSVNGVGMPYGFTDQSTGGTTTLQSDVYTINRNGTYSEVINESTSNGYGTSPTTDDESGTWSQSGNTITFQPTYSSFSSSLAPYSASLATSGAFGSDVLVFTSSLGQLVYQHE